MSLLHTTQKKHLKIFDRNKHSFKKSIRITENRRLHKIYGICIVYKCLSWRTEFIYLFVCMYVYTRTSPLVFEISLWSFAHVLFYPRSCSFIGTADIRLLIDIYLPYKLIDRNKVLTKLRFLLVFDMIWENDGNT